MTPAKRAEIEAELRTIRVRMEQAEIPEGLSDEEMIAWLQRTADDLRRHHESLRQQAHEPLAMR